MKPYEKTSWYFWPMLTPLIIVAFFGSLMFLLVQVNGQVRESRIIRADTERVLSAARAYVGMHCADPPAAPVEMAAVLEELGWHGHARDPGPWSVRLIDGPDSCTGAHVLYTGGMNRSLKKALRRKCARWNDTGAELLVRPTVITDGRGAYRLRWDDNITC